MMLSRAQSGIELTIFFSFLMMILIVVTFEAANRSQIIMRSRDALEAEKAGGMAATQVNIAVSVGDGYSSKFYMPYGLTNSNYSIQISTQLQRLQITYGDMGYGKEFPLLTGNVTGNIKQGLNIISNQNGMIVIA